MTSPPIRDIASWRREYEDRGLSADDLPADPIAAFVTWIEAARNSGLHEPNAMVVSSVGPNKAPSSRMVLLKTVDARGFVFFTNLESRKGGELLANTACALLFPWHPLERQVRIEGVAEVVSDDEADAYFASRPRGSQIGAWASMQSAGMATRAELEARVHEVEVRFKDAAVTRPPFWSGFRVVARSIEFWTRDPARLHERVIFQRAAGQWTRALLYP